MYLYFLYNIVSEHQAIFTTKSLIYFLYKNLTLKIVKGSGWNRTRYLSAIYFRYCAMDSKCTVVTQLFVCN